MSENNRIQTISSYVGLGSRTIPPEYQHACREVGKIAAQYHVLLRTNTNAGTAEVFEDGCFQCRGSRMVYLPYKGFNNRRYGVTPLNAEHFAIAGRLHPNWKACNQFAKMIHGNTVAMLLGETLNDKAGALFTYTKNGITTGSAAFGIMLAEEYGIPIINAGKHKPGDFINLSMSLIRDGLYLDE